MGKLIKGQWSTEWYDTESTGGKFQREDAGFRDRVALREPGRYHLYVSLACPWAHRTLIFRQVKNLAGDISVSVVDPYMGDDGWAFSDGPACIPDFVNGKRFMHEIYTLAKPDYTGRVTVPVLWDKERGTIVSNESAEIIRIFNEIGEGPDFYPEPLREAIDTINEFVYDRVNNGVYKAGFATKQEVYEEAFIQLFDALDALEVLLSDQPYLVGDTQTEADWRLFTTLVRFDPVYVGHFKCNRRRIADYPALSRLVSELYRVPGIAETVDFRHIKEHYYRSHPTINPNGIVPAGPDWQP